jgi:hypothetical protein
MPAIVVETVVQGLKGQLLSFLSLWAYKTKLLKKKNI